MMSLATKGTLELDEKLIDVLGMAPSFWVAVALAYLEFLEDREVSLSLRGEGGAVLRFGAGIRRGE